MAMDIGTKDYKLSCELRGHKDEVRRICLCGSLGITTSSRDRTVRLWLAEGSENRKYSAGKILRGHTRVIGPVAWVPPSEELPEGGVVSGSMDTNVIVWDLSTGKSARTLSGHQLQVTGIALDEDEIISSSLDCTLRRWKKGQAAESWEAHDSTIHAVIKLPSGELVTGSSDRTLKLWKGTTCVHTFFGHSDTVSGLAYMHERGILSASHDGSIRLWALTGEILMEMVGHSSIVYSVDSHMSGLIVSSSEDCTAKIWKDEVCIQSIEHPGRVWDAKFLENGDIITACSDAVVRIWTSEQSRLTDPTDDKSCATQVSHYEESSLFVSTGEASSFDLEAQDYISGSPRDTLSLGTPGTPSSPCSTTPDSHDHSDTPPASPGSSDPFYTPPSSPSEPRIWMVIDAGDHMEIYTIASSQVIEECRLSFLEKDIIQEDDMVHPSYILPRDDHIIVILPQILAIIKERKMYIRIYQDSHLLDFVQKIYDKWLARGHQDETRFDLHVMEFLFQHSFALLKEKANFQEVSVMRSAPTANFLAMTVFSAIPTPQPDSLFDPSALTWLLLHVVCMLSPIWSPIIAALCARAYRFYYWLGAKKRNDMLERMKQMRHLIRETRNIKEAAERCWGLFSVENRKSSYMPYMIGKFEDSIRILSDSLEELESRRSDSSLKREIYSSSSSSFGSGLGILATASVGFNHDSAVATQVTLFAIGCVLIVFVILCGVLSYVF